MCVILNIFPPVPFLSPPFKIQKNSFFFLVCVCSVSGTGVKLTPFKNTGPSCCWAHSAIKYTSNEAPAAHFPVSCILIFDFAASEQETKSSPYVQSATIYLFFFGWKGFDLFFYGCQGCGRTGPTVSFNCRTTRLYFLPCPPSLSAICVFPNVSCLSLKKGERGKKKELV